MRIHQPMPDNVGDPLCVIAYDSWETGSRPRMSKSRRCGSFNLQTGLNCRRKSRSYLRQESDLSQMMSRN